MTFDTFESLKKGDKVRRVCKKRVYIVLKVVKKYDGKRAAFLNGSAMYFIESTPSLESVYHYINWDKVQA